MAESKFVFKDQKGTVDDNGFIRLGGMGFQWSAAKEELKKAIEEQTGKAWMNSSFSNGRQKAQQEIANKWPVLNAAPNSKTFTVDYVLDGKQQREKIKASELAGYDSSSPMEGAKKYLAKVYPDKKVQSLSVYS